MVNKDVYTTNVSYVT